MFCGLQNFTLPSTNMGIMAEFPFFINLSFTKSQYALKNSCEKASNTFQSILQRSNKSSSVSLWHLHMQESVSMTNLRQTSVTCLNFETGLQTAFFPLLGVRDLQNTITGSLERPVGDLGDIKWKVHLLWKLFGEKCKKFKLIYKLIKAGGFEDHSKYKGEVWSVFSN